MARGVLEYFPDALAEVAFVSFVGNMKHNPGQELHWSKGKSDDHADCVIRHLASRGKWDIVEIDGKAYSIRHSAYAAWRALANLQIEIETENKRQIIGQSPPEGYVFDPTLASLERFNAK